MKLDLDKELAELRAKFEESNYNNQQMSENFQQE